ncbi:aldehyde dehydrogenase family protein [Gelidibacter gilvus]|uniref:Aldehyde dehydrogenase family protein n=1 Tax=Gelidibacter gilvus TaxID=59602 RepID=A0A4Q0XHY5_9FLAO|nr:aldehyde dehydrogenase family protein [Gelidibacter gilvus]RXJ51208.1 aldehyde dehydrogenase family protein [Gelidibacter gilvus]
MKLKFDYKKVYSPYINGEFLETDDQKTIDSINPYNNEVLAKVRLASPANIQTALASAVEAQKTWGVTIAKEREAILLKAADIAERRRPELAKALIDEGGNVFGKAMYEVDYIVSTFRIAAGQTRQIRGETMPAEEPNRISFTYRMPLGVVVGIGPFNAPLLLNSKKLAPAIAAGNSFILKPSPYTPIIALLFAEIFHEAGLPKGVLSVLPTADEDLGDTLFSDPRTNMITFTGSAKVGNKLQALAGKFQKRFVPELGGKSPLVILKDADLDYAVRSAAFGIFFNQSQVCMANSRIIVEDPIYDDFIEAFVKHVKTIKVGDPSKEDTAVGPLISKDAIKTIETHIEDAVKKGAKLHVGGHMKDQIWNPSVLSEVTSDMKVFDDETFAPLVSVYRAKDYEDALAKANDTYYGLSSGIITNDLQKAFDFSLRIQAGSVHINDNSFDDDPNAPFGGFKGSGHGKENGQYSIADMTQLKWVTVQLGERPLPF